MRKFIKRLFQYALALAGTVVVIAILHLLIVAPQYSQGYNASIIDKEARLRNLSGPKIILIGDSNLPYGMDSAVLEEAIGLPVVNLGLHGGLGEQFHERMALDEIGQGDIVIVMHTSYGSGKLPDPELAWITIENHFDLWKIIPPGSWPEMLRVYPKYAAKCFVLFVTGKGNLPTEDAYRRGAFNEYGDVAVERPDGIYEKNGAQHTALLQVSDEGIERLNKLNADCQAADATLLLSVYPVMDDGQAPSPEAFREVTDSLDARTDAPVISDFADYYFPPEMFYNTAYHMTSNGAHQRALQLAKDLKAYLESN